MSFKTWIFYLKLGVLLHCLPLYPLVNICADILPEFNLIKCPNLNFFKEADCSSLCSNLSMSFKICIFHLNLGVLLLCASLFPLFNICVGILSELNLIKCSNHCTLYVCIVSWLKVIKKLSDLISWLFKTRTLGWWTVKLMMYRKRNKTQILQVFCKCRRSSIWYQLCLVFKKSFFISVFVCEFVKKPLPRRKRVMESPYTFSLSFRELVFPGYCHRHTSLSLFRAPVPHPDCSGFIMSAGGENGEFSRPRPSGMLIFSSGVNRPENSERVPGSIYYPVVSTPWQSYC